MDLLGETPALSVLDESWRIYTRHQAAAPQFIGKDGVVQNSSITAGCEIEGTVKNSVLGCNVRVEAGAVVEDSVLMSGVTVKAGAAVKYAILDSDVTVGADARVVEDRTTSSGISVVGADYRIADGEIIPAGAMISEA